MTSKTEWVERRSVETLHEAASPQIRDQLGLALYEIDGAAVSVCAGDGSILLNRTIGLGLNAPATEAGIARIKAIYDAAEVGRYFIHVAPQAEPKNKIRHWLGNAGFETTRGWMKFFRDNAPAELAKSDLTVREIDSSNADDFARVCGNAFDISKAAQPALAALVDHPNWHIFMSFDGETPAGTGGLYVEDGAAVVDYGATDPKFRRRGSQSIVLAARIEAARALGVTLITTETGEAVEGDAQHSYSNILKRGFHEDYLRENWALPK